MNFRPRHSLLVAMLSAVLCGTAQAAPSGKEIHEQMVTTLGVYDDPELTMYVAKLVNDIISVSEKKGETFTFTLLDSPDVNAFATKGNYVYVNRGLLAYVQNEAQLVSVMAHEVGHVTKGHVSELQGQAGGTKFLAWLAGFLAGSNEVYEAGMAYANSLVMGHGRENELEADQAAAQYMAALGYDPAQMIDMLTIMKEMETMQKAQAGGGRTYHGIFSTHPRNDMRLRSAVSKAAKTESTKERGNGEDRLRAATEGMVFGQNFQEKEQASSRYANQSQMVRFDFPDGWSYTEDAQKDAVMGKEPAAAANLTMTSMARTAQEPEEYLYNQLNMGQLRDGREIAPARLKGFTGILPGQGGAPDQRVALVYYKLNAYLFIGEVSDASRFSEFDPQFLAAVDTFRPISGREIAGQAPKKIHYVKATSATTFEQLAAHLKLNANEADELRLMNGYYPTGEPKPGEWIKIIQQ
jgi:predicted Zn-dependent protease